MSKFLDYDGLKEVVRNVREEMPKPDGSTIIKNADGTLSANVTISLEVDSSKETLIFK